MGNILDILKSRLEGGGIIAVIFILVLMVLSLLLKLKLNAIKGWIGEFVVKLGLSRLPKDIYKRFDNVYVPGEEGGVTEIDHVIVSRFGIFVVETKNYDGYLYGTENDRRWTQSFNKHAKVKIGNPLRQNEGHISYLMKFLNMPKNKFYSVVCFVGSAVIKTPLPDYAMTRGWEDYILSFEEAVLSEQDALDVADKISGLKAAPSLKSKHRRYLRERKRKGR